MKITIDTDNLPIKKIQVVEVFGPLVGSKLVTYQGYWINETLFIAKRPDGTLTLRELTNFGSQFIKTLT